MTDLPTLKARLRELQAKSTIRSRGFLTREAERAEEQLRDLLRSSLPTLLDALDAAERAPATTVTTDEVRELRRLYEQSSPDLLDLDVFEWSDVDHELLEATVTLLPALLDLAEGYYRPEHITHVHRMGPIRGVGE